LFPSANQPGLIKGGFFLKNADNIFTKEFIRIATFKHPPLKGGEIIDPLSLEGRG